MIEIVIQPEGSLTLKKKIVEHAINHGFKNFMFNANENIVSLRKNFFFHYWLKHTDGKISIDGTFAGTLLKIESRKDIYNPFFKSSSLILLKFTNWKIVPLETIIANYPHKKIYIELDEIEQIETYMNILERGVTGIVLKIDDLTEIDKITKIIRPETTTELSFKKGVIKEIFPKRRAYRVCVDTCELLDSNEGALVGSFARCLFFVYAETAKSEHIASRPFRINAGSVHSYILTDISKTAYLSEIQAGNEILVCNLHGIARKVIVGRAKIEIRPMVLLNVEIENDLANVLLQNAETVYLSDGKNRISVPTIKKDMDILCYYTKKSAKHDGKSIEEHIIEV